MEVAVRKGFTAETVNTLLDGFNGHWADNSKITLLNNKDLQELLSAAQNFVTQVHIIMPLVFRIMLTPF